jgi:hypothetical protein
VTNPDTIPHLTPQPIPLSRQQRPAPAAFSHAPTLPFGWELVEQESYGAITVLKVLIDGKLYRWRHDSATGNGELTPLH